MASTPNIWLSRSEDALAKRFGSDDYFIAHIDGQKAITLRQFYEEIADVLEFPVSGYNLDALNDSLNDLQWLEDVKIVLYVTATDLFVSKERDPIKLSSILQIFDATAEDWKWVEDDELMERKEFYVVLEDSPRIREVLQRDDIAFGEL
ncbi:barnase inhibitor [Rudanella paleaurantiibacter]|uniref:Barnase inhibitor n=1 Tax=Rudanella paleaurantiibacter TaxID=2614655 RepID=A0A7J5TXF0_9BACT|nr:barstar family protein [Rudanella paleaurantiibacter]KAB7729318.1 barnase inhibitor [Rudanella paleaurantiibacter]